jgi:hypothetical protein
MDVLITSSPASMKCVACGSQVFIGFGLFDRAAGAK